MLNDLITLCAYTARQESQTAVQTLILRTMSVI